jgi:type I restriction enzyme S subunit
MKLAPYPEYKESGVSWLGKIPAHWDCLPHRAVFSEVKVQGHIDEPLLSVTIAKGIIPQSKLLANSSKKDSSNLDKSKYKLVCPDDIVYNKMRAWQGAIGVSRYRGIVSPAYIVVRLRRAGNPNYFHYLLRTPLFAKEAERWSYGITPDMWSLRPEHFKLIYSCVPRHEEQTQIARFLDWKTSQINKFIRNKRRLIELLKEQKQNVINQAVTRGLDPKVNFKPSGVEWIGDIPEHWDATKLKRVVSFNPSKSETRANPADEEKVVFLPMENISVNGDIDCSEKRALSEVWNGFTYFRRGDVVVAKITPCFENGKGAYLKGLESDFGFGTTELIVLRPSKAIDGAFLRFLTSTKQFLLLGEQYMTGAAGQQRIPSDFVKNYPIGLPPIDEQLEILEHIQEKSAEIDQAISRAQSEIELMREYRTRLISDVVTGQVDVRGIEVPEVAEGELLALDEDTGEPDDVIDDEGDMDETD